VHVHEPQAVLGHGISLFSSLLHPVEALLFILHEAKAVLVHDGHAVLGLNIALLGVAGQELFGAGKFLGFKGRHSAGKIHIQLIVIRHQVLQGRIRSKKVSYCARVNGLRPELDYYVISR